MTDKVENEKEDGYAVDLQREVSRYHFLEKEIARRKNEIESKEHEIEGMKARLEDLEPWCEELKSKLCGECNGHGKVRHHIAQDDCRIEECTRCKGTGVRG